MEGNLIYMIINVMYLGALCHNIFGTHTVGIPIL